MRTRTRIRAICLDVGGTLVEHGDSLASRWAELLGEDTGAVRSALQTMPMRTSCTAAEALAFVCEQMRLQIDSELAARILESGTEPARLRQGAGEFFSELSKTRCEIVVISNCVAWEATVRFPEDWHDRSSYVTGLMKPEVAVFRMIETEFQVSGEEVLMFGDSAVDLACLHLVGWQTLSTGTKIADQGSLGHCDSLMDAADVLRQLRSRNGIATASDN